jgi:polyisoprenoid-binding protein YceI
MPNRLWPTTPRARASWVIGAVVAAVVLIVGGPWFYIHVISSDEPGQLTLPAASAGGGTGTTAAGSASGTPIVTSGAQKTTLVGEWTIGEGSVVGYRVQEVLFGQSATATGRTSDVTGSVTVAGNAATKAEFTADMTTVKSDKDKRDAQFRGRIMDVASNPTATFSLTKPIDLPAEAGAGSQFTASATGDLTLHGTTKSATFDVTGQRSGNGFDVVAQIPIVFADYGVPNPSIAAIKTEDHGILEVLLKLVPKG